MYLKSIEIQGFKSFAQKTSLNFNTGVTAIVGPNGSGKSNISDAVRWVLGEQKPRQLRGSAMQDVIFAGTEVRKPQGFAYVCMTLDNSDHMIPLDYEEVSVSRKLYRSGESEYRLNSQQVRLKDIQEIFYDLGVGRDGYSIISQGQVEAILSSRDEDRRGIFDEAAGIVRSRARKQAALKKLESEQASLLRITDIVNELEGRVGPLKAQAGTARKYLALKEEQKKLDLNLFIRDTRILLSNLEKSRNDLAIAKDQFDEATREKERLGLKEAELSERMDALSESISLKNSEISKAELLKQNLLGQIDVANTEIKSREAESVRFKEELDKALADETSVRMEAFQYLGSLDKLEESIRIIRTDRAYAELEAETGGAENMLSGLAGFRKRLGEVLGEEVSGMDTGPSGTQCASRSDIPVIHENNCVRQAVTGGLNMTAPEGGSAHSAPVTGPAADDFTGTGPADSGPAVSPLAAVTVPTANGPAGSDFAGTGPSAYGPAAAGPAGNGPAGSDLAGTGPDDSGSPVPEWLKSIQDKRMELENIREKEQQISTWLAAATEEYNTLTDELKKLRNEYNSVQQLFSNISARYESLRNIAERYEGYGESVKAVMRKKDSFRGIHGVVADLIKTEKTYETAIEIALGGRIQNIVTSEENEAKSCVEYLRRTKQGRATFLPLSAVRYRKQKEYGLAAGEQGAVGLAIELVEYEEVYRELAGYLLGNVLVADNIDSAIAIAGKYRHSLRIVTLDGDLLSPGGAISGGSYRNSSSLMSRSRELDELEAERRAARASVGESLGRIRETEHLVADKTEEIDSFNNTLRELTGEKNRLSYSIMSDVKLRFSEFSQSVGFVSENIERVLGRYNELKERIALLRSDSEAASEYIARNLETVSSRKEDIAHIEGQIAVLSEELMNITAEKEELASSRSSHFERREELDRELLTLQKELIRLENAAEKDQQKLDTATDYIWQEYELSLSSAAEYYDEELGTQARVRSRLGSVKNEIRALGNVNVNAVEEYEEVSGRYEFMSAQYRDLLESRTAIESIIKELDEDMKKRFRERFAEIRELFSSTYKELFGGGYADLRLVYDDGDEDADELNAGIAIEAQPPGKRLKSMMQLSGGEKALTAIALLFAIQKLKPSPFCLLDEIEASLDDINVARFASYLRNMSGRTQFIVITHRRGTMESADRLYGVTMQERGVSKLISVDLISDGLE